MVLFRQKSLSPLLHEEISLIEQSIILLNQLFSEHDTVWQIEINDVQVGLSDATKPCLCVKDNKYNFIFAAYGMFIFLKILIAYVWKIRITYTHVVQLVFDLEDVVMHKLEI